MTLLSTDFSFDQYNKEINIQFKLDHHVNPDSKIHEANMGPIWGRQDPGGPHVGPMNIAEKELFRY